jgi:DNA-binding winged helix-turn-helix (wHTH) protein/tetratricopeptide (TPR) repeat protein/TolB-like protein
LNRAAPILRFGVFELNLATEELRKFGTLIKLAPQPFELLALLASQAGQVVTREQIQYQLWGQDTFVDFEQGMNHCIRQIRNVLGDSAETPRYVETIPRRGYRFVAPVEVVNSAPEESLVKFSESQAAKSDSGPVSVAPGAAAAQQPATSTLPAPPEIAPVVSPPATGRLWIRTGLIALAIILAAAGGYRIFRGRLLPEAASVLPQFEHRKTVAVLGFKSLSAHADVDIPLSTALSTMLGTELAAGDQLRVVPSAEVEKLKLGMHLGEADSLPADTLRRIRSALGADYVVLGSYLQQGGQVRVDLRVQDTRTGEIASSLAASGSDAVSGLGELVSNASTTIRSRLGVPALAQDQLSGIEATRPAASAAAYYYQGLAKLRSFDALAAREQLEKAVEAEPNFAPAHLALAEALDALGYSKLAREQAEKAYNNSERLPAREKLLVEARYNELSNKWDNAIALYRKLWEGDRNIDYGLRLAGAQTKAGKGRDALATLRTLRTLPQPERDDLRIDLEEAGADYALGNYEQEQAAADAAAHKAESLGGGFGLARARKAQGRALFYRGRLDDAIEMYRQSLSISQVLGDKGEIAASSNNIAGVLQQQGKLTAALELYGKALAANRELGNRKWEAGTLSNMGGVYQLLGQLQDARRMYEQSLAVYRDLGDRMYEAIVLNNIAEMQFFEGNLAAARQTYNEAIALDRKIQNSSNEAEALYGLGQVLAAQGDLGAAENAHQKAFDLRKQLKQEDVAEQSRMGLALIALAKGDGAGAAASAAEAAKAFHGMDLPDREVEALILLARADLAQGKHAEAEQAIAQAQSAASGFQNRILLMDLSLASAQVGNRSDDPHVRADSVQKLTSIVEQSKKAGYLQIELAASVALAQADIEAGNTSAGRTKLATLRQQAAAKGFGLVASQAATAEKMKTTAVVALAPVK